MEKDIGYYKMQGKSEMRNDLISIILPVYNGEDFLEEAIKSILKQTYSNFELIIINDASTDSSLTIAKEFSLIDERIRIFSNEKNLLLPESLNLGHKYAKGEYITWTSDDNLLKPNFLKTLLNNLLSTGSDIIYSDYDIILENGDLKRIHRPGSLPELIFENIIGASFLYKRNVFYELNGYDKSLFLVEDYYFFLKASLLFKFHHISISLYQYRIHSNSLTGEIKSNEQYSERYREALSKMYVLMGDYLNWDPRTSEFLLTLNLSKSIDLEHYLDIKDILKEDISKYNLALKKNGNLIKKSDFLNIQVRRKWQDNKRQQNLRNLISILRNDKSLMLVQGFNRNSNIRLILSCILNKQNFKFLK